MRRSLIPICTTLAATVVPSLAQASEVGQYPIHIVTGDFDGDQLLDRVEATPKADGPGGEFQGGKIELFLGDGTQNSLWYKQGNPNWGDNEPLVITEDDPVFGGSAGSYRRFGSGLVVGDFDDDGIDDLAFSAPGASVDGTAYAGLVYVLYGKDLDTSGTPYYVAASTYQQGGSGVAGSAEIYDYFGEMLTVGDFDCDGVDDLAIGVPRENFTIAAQNVIDAGAVHVLYGTAGGLTTTGDEYFAESLVGGTITAYDQFGGALTAGLFSTQEGIWFSCDTLAIGVPKQEIGGHTNAGAVYTAPGTLAGLSLSAELWHQDVTGVDGTAADNEEFGSRLGTVGLPVGEKLWIEVPGELCGDADETRFQVIESDDNGLTTDGDVRFCSRHEPGLRDTEVGYIVEKRDSYGPYMQYLPHGVDESSEMLVLIHGTPTALTDDDEPWEHAARAARFVMDLNEVWVDVAERENLILVAPGFSVPGFGSFKLDDNHSAAGLDQLRDVHDGYRNLYGRDIQADAWVNRIVDSYAAVGLNPSGEIYIHGHSAGGQMVTRYLARNPDRVLAAEISSPKTLADPDDDTWPSGLATLPWLEFKWMNDELTGLVVQYYSFTADPDDWAITLQKPIYLDVGEEENLTNGYPHVDRAVAYEASVDDFLTQRGLGETSGVDLCIVQGQGHSYPFRAPIAAERLFPDPNGGPAYTCVSP